MTANGWGTTYARWLVREVDERAGTTAADLALLSVSEYRGVVPRRTDGVGQLAAEDTSHYKVCRTNDIVLNRLWAFRRGIGRSPGDGLVSPDYAVLRPFSDVDPRFLHYLFRSDWFVGEMTARLRGIGSTSTAAGRKPRLNVLDFGTIPVQVPPLSDQGRIADFLDAETAQIDRTLATASTQFDLAEERLGAEAAAVFAADGPLPFTAWPGAVPAGYIPLWLAARTFSGKTLQPDQQGPDEQRTPYLKASNIGYEKVELADLDTMWASPTERSELRIRSGDVFVIEGGATAGKAAQLADEPDDLTILQNHVHCVRASDGFSQRFLYWVLRAYYGSKWYPVVASAVTFGSFPASKLRALPVPKVDLGSQETIAARLDDHHATVEAVRAHTDRFQELLDERKQALVTAAVTGQITV